MTWGDVQISALNKMFAKDETITVADLDDLREDDDTSWYLGAMPAVCNEALQRLKAYCTKLYKKNDSEEYEKTTIAAITDETADSYEIPLPEDACVLIPLYIASQLYKDDDVSQATQYRNEFEVGLQDLMINIENQNTIEEVF